MSSLTLSRTAIDMSRQALESTRAILKKAESHPKAASFPDASLIDTMKPLSFQIHVISDLISKAVARTSGTEPQTLENDLKTFADFYARLDQAQSMLDKADTAAIDKRAGEDVTMGLGPGVNIKIPAGEYVLRYTVPNLMFHVTTAYGILRKEGVELGKTDYLGPFLAAVVGNN